MVEFGIDEATIVISLGENKALLGGYEWESLAEWGCRQIETALSLQEVFGSRTTCYRPVQGYTGAIHMEIILSTSVYVITKLIGRWELQSNFLHRHWHIIEKRAQNYLVQVNKYMT